MLLPPLQPLWRTVAINRAMYRTFQLVLIAILLSAVLSNSVTRHLRVKKHAADQRVFELQALLALAKNLPDVHEIYGHGHVNPFAAGRRKRSVNYRVDVESQIPELPKFVEELERHDGFLSSSTNMVDEDRPLLLRALETTSLRHRLSVSDDRR